MTSSVAEHLHAVGIEPGLLPCLAERRGDDSRVAGIDAAAGERDLTGVRPERGRTCEQQHVEVARHCAGLAWWSLGSASSTPNSISTAAGRAPGGMGRSANASNPW